MSDVEISVVVPVLDEEDVIATSLSRLADMLDGVGGTWEVVVAIVREVPTIACRAPGGVPAKPGREYGVSRLERVG